MEFLRFNIRFSLKTLKKKMHNVDVYVCQNEFFQKYILTSKKEYI